MKRSYVLIVTGSTLLFALGYFFLSGTTANETQPVSYEEKKLLIEENTPIKSTPQHHIFVPSASNTNTDSESDIPEQQIASFRLAIIPKQGLPREHNVTKKTSIEFHIFDRRISDGKVQKTTLEVPHYVIDNSDMFELVVTELNEGKSLSGELSFLSAISKEHRYVVGIEYYDTLFYAEVLEEKWDDHSPKTLDELESLIPLKAPPFKLKQL